MPGRVVIMGTKSEVGRLAGFPNLIAGDVSDKTVDFCVSSNEFREVMGEKPRGMFARWRKPSKPVPEKVFYTGNLRQYDGGWSMTVSPGEELREIFKSQYGMKDEDIVRIDMEHMPWLSADRYVQK